MINRNPVTGIKIPKVEVHKEFFTLYRHSGRHTFATMALTHDIDLYTVSKLLGHKEIKTTQIYAKLVDKKKDETVKKIPVI